MFESLSFGGDPNLLSRRHQDWSVIDEASAATAKPRTNAEAFRYEDRSYILKKVAPVTGAGIIRKRRSAIAFDARTALAREHFFDILDRTLPRNRCAPFDVGIGHPSVHLLISFTRHWPGTWSLLLCSWECRRGGYKQKCRQAFSGKNAGSPEALPLYILEHGDFRSKAEGQAAIRTLQEMGPLQSP
jgi:hypothetical protein